MGKVLFYSQKQRIYYKMEQNFDSEVSSIKNIHKVKYVLNMTR